MINKQTAVLITGVGGGVGQSIIKGLKLANQEAGKRAYRLIGVDRDAYAAGLYRCDRHHLVPNASDPDYVPRLSAIAKQEKADFIIPGTDPEVAVLAKARAEMEKNACFKVLVSTPESVETGFDKWQTYCFLKKKGFPTPETCLGKNAKAFIKESGFPVIIKPRFGSASNDLVFARDEQDVAYALRKIEQPLVQEYLIPENWKDGNRFAQYDEFSTEVLMDEKGEPISSITNWRRLKKGVPNVAITIEEHQDINQMAEKMAKELNVFGPANFQSRRTRDGVKFFEINTRFSGSTAVRCMAGRNGPHIIMSLMSGKDISTLVCNPVKKFIEFRFNQESYLFIDTIDELSNAELQSVLSPYF